MRAVSTVLSPRSLVRAVALVTVALVTANCSSDAVRMQGGPFADHPTPPETTGSVPRGPMMSGPIDSRPMPAPVVTAQPIPPPPPPAPANVAGMSGGGRGLGSYQPAPGVQMASADVTGGLPQLRNEPKPKANWEWEGGKPITVAKGDTLASLARRHGVPAAVIAQANGLTGPAALRAGQRLVIPRYSSSNAAPLATRPAEAASAPATSAPMSSGSHVVAPGETLVGIARRYHVSITALAKANNIAPHAMVKMGDRLVIPGKNGTPARAAEASPAARPALAPAPAPLRVASAAPTPVPAPAAPPARTPAAVTRTAMPAPPVEKLSPAPAPTRVATAEPTASIRVATPADEATGDDDRGDRNGAIAFRWPVKGRVINNFGSRNNGQLSDGIDLAVPEGTAVRAAEDGVVAYAGSELKGYGNLILVRHSNGYVTAYAHASELMVKRNDKVRRGQVIAKSGQTGSVSAPQLHFEIRKGSTPVNPMQHLPGA